MFILILLLSCLSVYFICTTLFAPKAKELTYFAFRDLIIENYNEENPKEFTEIKVDANLKATLYERKNGKSVAVYYASIYTNQLKFYEDMEVLIGDLKEKNITSLEVKMPTPSGNGLSTFFSSSSLIPFPSSLILMTISSLMSSSLTSISMSVAFAEIEFCAMSRMLRDSSFIMMMHAYL